LDFGYGVLYQSANHPDPVAQALLLAHELVHSLDAQNDPSTEDVVPHYIMEPIEDDGSDGSSQTSIDSTLALIDSDSITYNSEEVVPTSAPRETPVPSTVPLKTPSVQTIGSNRPTITLGPTTQPSLSVIPSVLPSAAPSKQPSETPTIQPTTKSPNDKPTAAPSSPNPTPGPTNPPGCDFVPQSFCDPASGLNSDYACIPKVALVEIASSCDSAYFLQLTGWGVLQKLVALLHQMYLTRKQMTTHSVECPCVGRRRKSRIESNRKDDDGNRGKVGKIKVETMTKMETVINLVRAKVETTTTMEEIAQSSDCTNKEFHSRSNSIDLPKRHQPIPQKWSCRNRTL